MRRITPRRGRQKAVKNKNNSKFSASIIEKSHFFYGVILDKNERILEMTHHFLCKKIAVLRLNRRIRIFNSALPEKEKLEELHVQD